MSVPMRYRRFRRAFLISLVSSVCVVACASTAANQRYNASIYDCTGDWFTLAEEAPGTGADGVDTGGETDGAIGAVRLVRQEPYATRFVMARNHVYAMLDPHAELSSLTGPIDNLCPPLATRLWPPPLIDWTGHFRRHEGDHHCAQWPRSGDHRSMIYRDDTSIDMHINWSWTFLDNSFSYEDLEALRLYSLSQAERALHTLKRDVIFHSASHDSRYAYPVFNDRIGTQMRNFGRVMGGEAPERYQILAWLQLQHLPNAMHDGRDSTEESQLRHFEGRWFNAAVVRWPITGVNDSADGDGITLIVDEPRVALAKCESVADADVRVSPGQRRDHIRSLLPR